MPKNSLASEIIWSCLLPFLAAFLGGTFFLLLLMVLFAAAWLGGLAIGTDVVGNLSGWFDGLTQGSMLMIGLFFGAMGGMAATRRTHDE